LLSLPPLAHTHLLPSIYLFSQPSIEGERGSGARDEMEPPAVGARYIVTPGASISNAGTSREQYYTLKCTRLSLSFVRMRSRGRHDADDDDDLLTLVGHADQFKPHSIDRAHRGTLTRLKNGELELVFTASNNVCLGYRDRGSSWASMLTIHRLCALRACKPSRARSMRRQPRTRSIACCCSMARRSASSEWPGVCRCARHPRPTQHLDQAR